MKVKGIERRAQRGSRKGKTFPAPVSVDPGAARPSKKVGGQPGHKVSGGSLANLRKGAKRADGSIGDPLIINHPKLPSLTTDTDAAVFVKLRAAGVPAIEAITYFVKGDEKATPKQWAKAALEWERDPRVKSAWDKWNGGEWQDLDDDKRIEVAVAHHVAQCAFVLYTADISDPLANMKKIEYAKDTILAKLKVDSEDGSGNDVFGEFLRQLTTNAAAALPKTFKSGVSVPAEMIDGGELKH